MTAADFVEQDADLDADPADDVRLAEARKPVRTTRVGASIAERRPCFRKTPRNAWFGSFAELFSFGQGQEFGTA